VGGVPDPGNPLGDRQVPSDPLTLHVLRVFVGEDGRGGNPLGVFLDGGKVPKGERQRIATELGFSETVFVDDPEHGELRIFTPEVELPFAGHPLVGTAWLIAQEGRPVEALRPPAGEVGVRTGEGMTFIRARPEWSPPFEYPEFGSAEEVDALEGPPGGLGEAYCWAWLDEAAGLVRARSFAPEVGITEDEATGSAALALAARLGRRLEVRQGTGSRLLASPVGSGFAEVGGRTEHAETREFHA